jgi:hypothetical protein
VVKAVAGRPAAPEPFRDELGEDAARSLDAPFAMGKAGVLDALFGEAGVGDVSGVRRPWVAKTLESELLAD